MTTVEEHGRTKQVGTGAGAPRLRWIEGSAVAGVWKHETTLYRRYWPSTTFSSVVEPTIYLLAFGFGFGSLVAVVGGYRYLDFVGTGVVASTLR